MIFLQRDCSISMFSCPPSETQRIANSHLRKVSVSESNVLLDEEVLTDPKIQMLLLTVLVRNSGQVHSPHCSPSFLSSKIQSFSGYLLELFFFFFNFLTITMAEHIRPNLTLFIGLLVFELLMFGLNPYNSSDQPIRLITIDNKFDNCGTKSTDIVPILHSKKICSYSDRSFKCS